MGCWIGLLFLAGMPSWCMGQVALQMPPKSATRPPLPPPLPHPVLDRMHAANAVTCAVSKEEEDYTREEDHGNRAAFDIDLCKAVAVAALGTGAKLVVKSYPDEASALRAVRSGEADLAASASLSVRNTALGLLFSAPVLLDSQGFLLPNNPAVHSPLDLAGKKVCFLTGAAAEQGLHTYAEAHHVSFVWYPFSEAGEMEAAFFTGNCDAITSDLTQLINIRGIEARRSAEFTILPQTVREDPLAVATWGADVPFATLVQWTVQSLLAAEDLGVTQSQVGALKDSPRPEVRQLLGQPVGTGTTLGVHPFWGAEVIGAVGNYGEMFDRDLGVASPFHLERGENRLWSQGGALYAVPLRDH